MENKPRLVFGLGSGFVYACGGEGKWKEVLPKVLSSVPNDILISTVDMPKVAAKVIYDCVGEDRLYLDSGGFTLFKYEMKYGKDNPEFHARCEKMKKKFLSMLRTIKPKEVFELDNEYFRHDPDLLSPKNYCREEIKELLGYYPTPVFKLHQGFQYWKDLCDSDLYPRLAIGGLAQTRAWNTNTEELALMMEYAREKGKKVHLLGCQNVEAFKEIQPDSVDYSIFQYAINLQLAKQDLPELSEYKDLKQRTMICAVSRAKQRSFLYDSYQRESKDGTEI